MSKRFLILALVAWTVLPAFAQRRGGQPQGPPPSEPAPAAAPAQPPNEPAPGPGRQSSDREVAGPAEEKVSQTSHTVRLGGRELKYSATAGTLPSRINQLSRT